MSIRRRARLVNFLSGDFCVDFEAREYFGSNFNNKKHFGMINSFTFFYTPYFFYSFTFSPPRSNLFCIPTTNVQLMPWYTHIAFLCTLSSFVCTLFYCDNSLTSPSESDISKFVCYCCWGKISRQRGKGRKQHIQHSITIVCFAPWHSLLGSGYQWKHLYLFLWTRLHYRLYWFILPSCNLTHSRCSVT